MHLIEAIKSESLPALLLDLDAFDKNSLEIAQKTNGKTIRIATKSIRSAPLLRRILQSNPIYQGLMCFTPREALFLIERGFDDILLGYPCWDEAAVAEIAKLNRIGKKIMLMVDCIEQLTSLERVAGKVEGLLYLCIDVDMSSRFGGFHFGVRRSPLTSVEEVVKLAREVENMQHLQLIGIMGYEAQIAGVGDKVPGQLIKNTAVKLMKQKSITEVETRRREIIQALQNEGITLSFVNGGGTGSIATTGQEDVVTEITVGSGFYAPLLFDYYHDFQYQPSLFFALPVVRQPAKSVYTCLGGGYIASGAVGKDKQPQPVFPTGVKLLPMEAAGEVQTPIYYEKELNIGDPVIFRAAKAGEVCERFSEIICLSGGEIVLRVPTYRGEGGCFL